MLKLMSFNIRYGLADDGTNRWDNRKSLVIDRIKAFNPDLIGMQECRDDFQAKFIKNNLKAFEFYGVRRANEDETAFEMAPILFKKSEFQLVQRGCFWLSETPQTPGSISWGSTFPRTATWVQLIHQESGREFIFLNTHFDYEPSAIEKSAQLLKRWITQNKEKHPIIVTGDFNADKASVAYQTLALETGLSDAYRQIYPDDKEAGTFHGFGQIEKPTPIDWILVSDHFKASTVQIDRFHEGNLYPSDHYPVTASLHWE